MSGASARLLLVGGGHAHMDILRQLILKGPPRPVSLTVVSMTERHHYSGMVPGYLGGIYHENEIAFDLPRLVKRAGGRFVCGEACGLDPSAQKVRLADEQKIGYDLVSFNIGSGTRGGSDPAVGRNVELVKPISRAVQLKERIRRLVSSPPDSGPIRIAVVGGGSAGVEVAWALDAFLEAAGCHRQVTLVDGGRTILSEYNRRFRNRALAISRWRGIEILSGVRVTLVEADSILLQGKQRRPASLTVWLTGPEAAPLFRESGLSVSSGGFLLVDDTLRSLDDPKVFAVGDCATLARYPGTPKAGVYAVRQAPFLWKSLCAFLQGNPGPRYRPQEKFLSILNSADGKGLLYYKGLVSHSGWAWKLKDWIDRRFVEKYHALLQ